MSTIRDILVDSLLVSNILADGENPSASMLNNALNALKIMVDSWQQDSLFLYSTTDYTHTWPVNVNTQTLGPTGDIVGVRPLKILDSCYVVVQGQMSYPMTPLTEAQYNAIWLKKLQGGFSFAYFVNYTFPNITIKLYPEPSQAMEFHFIADELLTDNFTLDTVISLPQGYQKAFKYNLVCEIASAYGMSIPIHIQALATDALNKIKRINNSTPVMGFDDKLVAKNVTNAPIYWGVFPSI